MTHIVVAILVCAGASVSAQEKEPSANAAERREVAAESVVECLLPAEIDRLGSQLTKLAPRRTIETTAEECAARQGEVVDEPR